MAEEYSDAEFLKRLVPITEARRNFGNLVASLPEKGYLIFTKRGKPVAKLVDLINGGLKKEAENKLLFYAGMFKRVSYWNKDWGKIIKKWRRQGSRKAKDFMEL